MTIEFSAWPKTPRLNRECIITEKIDGTNAAVIVNPVTELEAELSSHPVVYRGESDQHYEVAAQSRKRLITPEDDNFGFARWVYDNAHELVRVLGQGYHFGEWWGRGIQRRYGLDGRKFSLFNVSRWREGLDRGTALVTSGQLDVVPVLYEGAFDSGAIDLVLHLLQETGSQAAPGFINPEGVIVFHSQSRQNYKVLLENDEVSKTVAGVA